MNASITIDDYVFDTLMRDLVGHDRRPAAFLLYVTLVAQAERGRQAWSHRQLAQHTGLAKRTVQDALRHLAARGLIELHRAAPTEVAIIATRTPWRR